MERKKYIDIAKGIGIFLVIWGHLARYTGKVSCAIFSFHMPLFFILSGMVFDANNITFYEFLKKKIKTVIFPFLSFYTLGFAVSIIIPAWRNAFTIEQLKLELYTGGPELMHVGQIWFLLSLFEVEVLMFFLCKIKDNTAIYSLFVLSLPFIMILIKNMLELTAIPYGRLPLKLDTTIMALFFFAFGYSIKQDVEIKNKLFDGLYMLIGIIVVLLAFYFNGYVNISSIIFNDMYKYVIMALLGSFATIKLALYIGENRMLEYIGRNSLYIFSLHSFGIYLYTYILSKIMGVEMINGGNLSFLQAVFGTIVVLVISLIFMKMYRKIIIIKKMLWKENVDGKIN